MIEVSQRASLAVRAGFDTPERRARVAEVLAQIDASGVHSVRVAFVDQHGTVRGKTIAASLAHKVFANGAGITSALLMKDTGQNNVYPVWSPGAGLGADWLTGAGDVIMMPDPSTFRVLPWAPGTGWVLSDLVTPAGQPVGLSTRGLCSAAAADLAGVGYRLKAGLEIEFHLYRVVDHHLDVADTPSAADRFDVAHTHPGYVYLAEQRFDQIEPALEPIRSGLTKLGCPPRSLEVELGPSQVELTFEPLEACEAADLAVIVRLAIKQIAHRHGFHATFMARPTFARSFSSGWHLHQSLVDDAGENLFVPDADGAALSSLGEHYLAGLLAHAAESCLLTTPTVTGYKRYRAESLAPDRVAWGHQHRGAMVRVVGTGGDPATHLENRVGDSAANPYLYVASQMVSGLAGIAAQAAPPPISEDAYAPEAGARLPRTLGAAIEVFAAGKLYRDIFGDDVVDYLVTLKQAEWARCMATVTDWEQREYFDLF